MNAYRLLIRNHVGQKRVEECLKTERKKTPSTQNSISMQTPLRNKDEVKTLSHEVKGDFSLPINLL